MDWIGELLRHDWMPHGFCIRWTPWLLWPKVAADSMFAISYFVISVAMFWFAAHYGYGVKQMWTRKITGLFYVFGVFIFLCGWTHVFDVVTLWWPYYALDVSVRLLGASVSVVAMLMVLLYGGKYANSEWSEKSVNRRLLDTAERLEKLCRKNG